ncbi:MAG: Hpt domain-containing protein, partial [Candidatus Obscuribacterales bacterium]|nr:Hpt domain-containing protein [Candidatus Obscuribacterales bacterium]
MNNWDNKFVEIKGQFMGRSKERLGAIQQMLNQLSSNPGDQNLLREILKNFHWLAGSGGTYGFTEITEWGTYGEELCEYLLKLNAPVSESNLDKLRTALN